MEPQDRSIRYVEFGDIASSCHVDMSADKKRFTYVELEDTTRPLLCATRQRTDPLDSTRNASFTYDLNGNLVRRATSAAVRELRWDARNTLAAVLHNGSEVGRYDYRWDGLRVKRNAQSQQVEYVLDDTFVLSEHDGSTSAHSMKRRYHYATQPLAESEVSEASRFTNWLDTDAQGSVTDATQGEGTVRTARQYDAWGNYRNGTAPRSGDPKLGYTGHQFDLETGLVYARARYYDPEIGIFVSRDAREAPVGEAPWLHRYEYVKDNPCRYIDVRGEDPVNPLTYVPDLLFLGYDTYEAIKHPSVGSWLIVATDIVMPFIPALDEARLLARGAKIAIKAGERAAVHTGERIVEEVAVKAVEHGAERATAHTAENAAEHAVANAAEHTAEHTAESGAEHTVANAGEREAGKEGSRAAEGTVGVESKASARGGGSSGGQGGGAPGGGGGGGPGAPSGPRPKYAPKDPQTREFGETGKPVKQVDWTDHGRPSEHTDPHVHDYIENPTGGTPQHGPARPPKPDEFPPITHE
jgi:RHS repeat-associated protein